jgi:hypothetical protein
MSFVPEGQHDRSLARSAWKSIYRENRPGGNGMSGPSYKTSQSYFSPQGILAHTIFTGWTRT